MRLEIWQAVVLGMVEGITEYLPISSTGHLILVAGLMGLGRDPQSKQSLDAFHIVVQGGAILAVVGLYWPHLLRMLKGLVGRDTLGLRLLLNLLAAFLPAAVLGKLLDDWIEARLFHPGPVLAAVLVGGPACRRGAGEAGRAQADRGRYRRSSRLGAPACAQAEEIGLAQDCPRSPGHEQRALRARVSARPPDAVARGVAAGALRAPGFECHGGGTGPGSRLSKVQARRRPAARTARRLRALCHCGGDACQGPANARLPRPVRCAVPPACGCRQG